MGDKVARQTTLFNKKGIRFFNPMPTSFKGPIRKFAT